MHSDPLATTREAVCTRQKDDSKHVQVFEREISDFGDSYCKGYRSQVRRLVCTARRVELLQGMTQWQGFLQLKKLIRPRTPSTRRQSLRLFVADSSSHCQHGPFISIVISQAPYTYEIWTRT